MIKSAPSSRSSAISTQSQMHDVAGGPSMATLRWLPAAAPSSVPSLARGDVIGEGVCQTVGEKQRRGKTSAKLPRRFGMAFSTKGRGLVELAVRGQQRGLDSLRSRGTTTRHCASSAWGWGESSVWKQTAIGGGSSGFQVCRREGSERAQALWAGRRRRKGAGQVVARSSMQFLDVKRVDEKKMKTLSGMRVVFGHEEWKRHTSSSRYLRHIASIFTSKIIASLGPPITTVTLIASFVVTWNLLVLDGFMPQWAPILSIPHLPFSLTVPALSFLLVFRTNSSYGRFEEARVMWGLMLNRSRDICRQALSYMARDEFVHEYPKRAQFLRHLQAFSLTYKHHFVEEGSLEDDLRTFTSLTENEIKGLLEATHRPNFCLQVMGECLKSCHMDPTHRLAMERNMVTFADDIGGSERLFKTPIPLSYTRLTSRFMILYHALLPFALWDPMGWLTIPATVLCTGVFFAIDEVGVIIENPFPILPLSAIAEASRNSINELIQLHGGIQSRIAPNDYIGRKPRNESDVVFAKETDQGYLTDWTQDISASPTNSQKSYSIGVSS